MMESIFLVYLLSIASNLSSGLDDLGRFLMGAAIFVYVASFIRHVIMSVEQTSTGYNSPVVNRVEIEKENQQYLVSEPKVRKFSLIAASFSVLFILLSCLFPTTRSVLESYAIIEGSKVINAPNAELAAEAIGKRFDRFLDIVDKGVSKNVQPVPVKEEKAK